MALNSARSLRVKECRTRSYITNRIDLPIGGQVERFALKTRFRLHVRSSYSRGRRLKFSPASWRGHASRVHFRADAFREVITCASRPVFGWRQLSSASRLTRVSWRASRWRSPKFFLRIPGMCHRCASGTRRTATNMTANAIKGLQNAGVRIQHLPTESRCSVAGGILVRWRVEDLKVLLPLHHQIAREPTFGAR